MSPRWLLWACLFPAIWGCVSLDYYEALREAYEKAEGRSLAASRELNRTKAEIAQLQKELAEMKLAAGSRPSVNGDSSVKEKADLLARRLEATQAELRVRDDEKARLDRELGAARHRKDAYGIKPCRPSAMGLAATRPVLANSNDDARARNRRVEIIVTPGR